MLCPMTCTSIWSFIVFGFVRKKKPRVRWKSDTEVMMVLEVMSAMVAGVDSIQLMEDVLILYFFYL